MLNSTCYACIRWCTGAPKRHVTHPAACRWYCCSAQRQADRESAKSAKENGFGATCTCIDLQACIAAYYCMCRHDLTADTHLAVLAAPAESDAACHTIHRRSLKSGLYLQYVCYSHCNSYTSRNSSSILLNSSQAAPSSAWVMSDFHIM